jgi:uncharacterized membrane protein
MKQNSELRSLARSQLKGSWLAAVGVCFVGALIISVSGAVVVGPIILGGPITLGICGYFMHKARNEPVKFVNLFDGFDLFGSSFLLYLLQAIFITLWTCLFVVPGIIKTLSYSMAFYILRDNPTMGASEAITASRKMMDGHKEKLFGLYLSFIGWALLCVPTFGIGYLWLIPYVGQATANFYEDIKGLNGEAT